MSMCGFEDRGVEREVKRGNGRWKGRKNRSTGNSKMKRKEGGEICSLLQERESWESYQASILI